MPIPTLPPQGQAAAAPRQPLPMVDLFARTEVAGLEVSFDEGTPSEHAEAFPSTELVGIDEKRASDDDFPKTEFERPT